MPKIMLNSVEYTGGGGDSGMELTYDEYLALTEEEKANGTTYYITDINGDGQSFQPVIYSEEEREIGVWTDGKPLYQKTFYYASLPSNNRDWQLLQESYPLEELVTYNAMCVYSGNRQLGNSNYIIISYYNGNLYYHTPSLSGTLTDVYVTIQYTKTTDQPGSGTWTPQGVPAVHYSIEEQVVGTWTDGNTIYEKTITGTLGNTSQKTIDLSSEINCNLIIDIKGWIMSTDSVNNYQIWMHDAYVRYYLVGNNLTINKNGADNYGWDNPYTFIIRYTKSA